MSAWNYGPSTMSLIAALQSGGVEASKAVKSASDERMAKASPLVERLGEKIDAPVSLQEKILQRYGKVREDNQALKEKVKNANFKKDVENTSFEKDMDVDYGEESIPNRPAGAEYFTDPELKDFSSTIKELKEDKRFSSKLAKLSTKYNISEREILMVGAKESSLMTNPSAKNMFQILATPAKEAGIDLNKLNKSKNPVDQLNALEKYLDRWNYADFNGSIPLGLIIAAPSARNQEKDFVVYREGSKELEANPKWAGEDKNATVGSITKFYRGDE